MLYRQQSHKQLWKVGVRKNIKDIELYKDQLTNRLDPTMSLMQGINAKEKS